MAERVGGRGAGRTISIAMVSTVVSVLPVFLVGALAVDIALDLEISPTGIGASVAVFRLGAAVTSRPLGRFTDEYGAHVALRSALALAGITSLFMAVVVRSFSALLVTLAVGGAAQALAQPAANRMLANGVPGDRLGRAFGVKQAAPPVASMLAGASVPLLATQVDWRAVYLAVPLLALPVIVALGRRPIRSERRTPTPSGNGPDLPDRRLVLVLAAAFGFANAATACLTAFFVVAAVAAGVGVAQAGTLLAVGSLLAVLTRLILGEVCDRRQDHHLRIPAMLLAIGAIASLGLATARPTWMAVGILLALGLGWGFNGVYWFAIVSRFRDAPGRVTGAIFPGGLLGSVLGPISYGAMVDGIGYSAAWVFTAALAGAAAALMWSADRSLDRRPS